VTDKTLLFRQIHPSFLQNGYPTYIAFRPFPRDNGHLSVYDGDMISPEQSYRHYTNEQELKSGGVMAVSVEECTSLELPAQSSPHHFKEHAHIDFTAYDKKQTDSKSKSLLAFAVARDWMYREDS
jgi:hypothetical protein